MNLFLFFNPYLDEGNSNWLKIEAISITNQSLDISYAFNEAAFDSENQKDVFKVTCKELDLLPRYACRSIEFILNQKKNIQKFCTKQTEVRNYFEIMLKQLPQDDFWKTQLCRYIAENETAQEIIFKYCNIANRWFFCKNSMRGPGYKESLDNYLNFVGNNEKRYIYFLSDVEFKQKIVCISNDVEGVSLKDETNFSVFVLGLIDFSDCEDADFYIFNSQGCTRNSYKYEGCKHGVLVLKKIL